jgi:hypothetical protein
VACRLQVRPFHPGRFVVDEAAHDPMEEAIGWLEAGDQASSISKSNFLGSCAIDHGPFLVNVFSKDWVGDRLWHHHIDTATEDLLQALFEIKISCKKLLSVFERDEDIDVARRRKIVARGGTEEF